VNFQKNEIVVHSSYGLGKIVTLEERTLYGRTMLYYVVQIDTMTIWVPSDDKLESRLRKPTRKSEFPRLIAILRHPGETLPEDRQTRKLHLRERLKDGRAESLCFVIRSLQDFHQNHSLNDNDQLLMERAQRTLSGEWSYARSISQTQADQELSQLLETAVEGK
jgi:RNA polymerase-interacting CarD/CdnL/TRCF family regulator